MNILDFKELGDWRLLNECLPFEDSLGNLCITVKSKYESFGGEKDARLKEAKEYGIDRLIRFYGKTYISEPLSTSLSQVASDGVEITISQASVTTITPTKLYDAASTPDNFISTRACARMKVLVKIPKSTFDDYTVNDAFCDINKPSEGYLSAFISVENYERDIDYITASMEGFLPKMAKANKYMTNINIVKEIKRLKQVKSVIRRYLNLNSVTATAIKEEECDTDVESLMEVGFDYNYNPVFVLIDGNKHTIGYDCFLEASLLNHSTTANYLIQLGNMSHSLTKQLSLDFDIFQFLTQHTYPTPVIEAKENTLDGLDKYDANGNLFSFANIAKLITLDLDKKSCKPDETVSSENRIILNKATRAEAARAAAQTKQFIGDWRLSTEGAEELKETLGSMWDSAKDPVETLKEIYNDIWEKTNWGCVLEESLQCMLEESITKFGTSVFDDPDLGQFFSADGTVEMLGLCRPDDGCENELQLRVGLPAFQGITIPANFPTTDYLAKTMDLALKQLYNVLINSLVSLIMSFLDNVCKMVSSLPDFPAIGDMFGDGFTSWLSETIGIDVSKLSDPQAWQDAVLSSGGTGFMGVVGNFSSKMVGSWDALVSETGVSLNLPNPNTGMVEEVFISPELISNVISGFRKATEDLEVVMTEGELNSLYKGAAPADVVELAFDCLNRGNPEIFQSPEDVSDLFSALGEMVNGSHLENPSMSTPVVTSMCDLGDGSNQDILRKNFLRKKDSTLSDSEIEELMSIEKSRFIEKIKKMHKLLKSFQDGSIFPDFPSIFGSEDSLIPEAPPVISAAMATVSEGLYSSTINNFNVSMLQYAPLWKERYELGITDPTSLSFAEHSKNLMINDTANPIWLNLLVDSNLSTLGYKISDDAEDDIDTEISAEATEEYIGTYDWGKDFDAGKYTTEKLNWFGEDDDTFAIMLSDAGIWNPEFSFIKEFIDWFIAPYVELDDWLDWIELILTLILAALVAAAGLAILTAIGLGTMGTGWVLVGSIVAILATAITLPPLMFMIVDLIPELEGKVENEVTREELECLHDKGKISDEAWNEIEPKIDEVVDTMNKLAITSQQARISEIGDYLQKEASQENGSHTKSFDITDMLEDSIKETLDSGTMVELVLKTEASGIGWGEGKNSFITKTYIRKTPATSEEVTLLRPPGFSEVITSFQRRGVRGDVTALTDVNFQDAIYTSLQDLHDSGIELVEYDRVESKISNYYMENQSSLLLGRKIPRSNMLEVRYSSTIDAPDNTATGLFQSQVEEGNNLQEYHKRLLEIFEEIIPSGETAESFQQILTQYKNDVVGMHEVIWKGCMENMAERVSNNRMYEDEYLNGLELEYPKQDILGYKKVSEASVDLTNSIMKLESSNGDYCDTLTPLRRSGSITGLRLMIRTFIVERVLNSLQVFDTFNIGFMTSDMFKKAVFDDIKVEMNKYYQSFASTLERDIFSDMKETASKYFEIQGLLGNEVPELNTDKEAILEIIKMEIDDISATIAPEMGLDKFYHSSSWDDFVFDILLTRGAYSSPHGFVVDQSVSILAPYFEANTRFINNNDGTYTHVAEILFLETDAVIRAECTGPEPEETTDDCEPIVDYSKVKTLLFNNEIYQDLISYVFPLKDAATLLSTYHLSAITDPAVFKATEDGKHVTDLFAETKLSTLQAFLASLHGAGETTYIDPFLEKLKT